MPPKGRHRTGKPAAALADAASASASEWVRQTRTGKPAARNWLKTVRALMQFSVTEGSLREDPTIGIKNLSGETKGYRTWDEDDIEAFEARHPIGTRERLALELLLCTAQRRSDVVQMGRQHIRNGAIEVRQQKTGTTLAIDGGYTAR